MHPLNESYFRPLLLRVPALILMHNKRNAKRGAQKEGAHLYTPSNADIKQR